MTGPTHKLSGKVVGSVAFVALNFDPLLDTVYSYMSDGTLGAVKVFDIKNTWRAIISALAVLIILRTFSKVTSVLNDLDQQPQSIPYKESIVARLFNRLLLALGQHHRSRLTHTIDIGLLWSVGLLVGGLQFFDWQSPVMLLIIGYVCGFSSHIIADMFNGTGVYLTIFSKKHVAFVPKKVNSLKLTLVGLLLLAVGVAGVAIPAISCAGMSIVLIIIACSLFGTAICCKGMTFTTGGKWEDIFYKVVNVVDVAVTTLACIICFL